MKSIAAIIVGIVMVSCMADVEAAPISTQPIHTQKTRFQIPYRYDPAEMQHLGAVEIQLYVSVNSGVDWQLVGSVAPEAGRFNFVAPSEGEYWFSVRTLDGQGRIHPPSNQIEPGLKVIVDSTPPTLNINLQQAEPGRIQLSWNASDRFLDPRKLHLEFIQPGSQRWQTVGIQPHSSGQTSWSVSRGGIVAVRGSVSDLASNIAHTERNIRIIPAAQIVPQPSETSDHRPPIAFRQHQHPDGSSAAANFQIPNSPLLRPELASSIGSTAPVPLQRNVSPPRQAADFRLGSGATIRSNERLVSDHRDHRPEIVSRPDSTTTNIVERPQPASTGTRTVDTNSFEIAYEIQGTGPSGIGRVEFYITQNDGAKWWKFGDDLDRKSPYHADVPGDGTYGFALRVRSGVGLSDDPPQPGEKPSIVVVVDRTPPVVRLLPAQQGQGKSLNKVLIRWRVIDENPSEKTISLAFSADRQGPWTSIGDWQENTGSYLWTVGDGVPAKLYIALSARDTAGNVARVVSEQPVIVDMKKPSARIVGVQSTSTTGLR